MSTCLIRYALSDIPDSFVLEPGSQTDRQTDRTVFHVDLGAPAERAIETNLMAKILPSKILPCRIGLRTGINFLI